MPYPNKYEDAREREKLWLQLSPEERRWALEIIRAREEQREVDFYKAKYERQNDKTNQQNIR